MDILFATSNPNKTTEIKAALPDNISLYSLKDVGVDGIEIDEPFETLEENAAHKAISYSKHLRMNCFSEDTGLEVFALNGAPGVKSARYAGFPSDTGKNIALLLENMKGLNDRNAQFRTVIALVINEKMNYFEGICKGKIIQEARGNQGFGYDPLFIPEGADITFAEMNTEQKNKFSHRKIALQKMIYFLRNIT